MNDVTDILNEREKTHGNYRDVASVAQMFREIMRDTVGWERMNDAQREALDSMASKFGRISSGNPHFRDHWDDLAGYATLASLHCDSAIGTIEQDIAKVVEQIKVGGQPTGVDEDGERFPEIVTLPITGVTSWGKDPHVESGTVTLPKVGKKGFFSNKKTEGE